MSEAVRSREFIEKDLGEEGLKKSVVVVETGTRPRFAVFAVRLRRQLSLNISAQKGPMFYS